MKDSESAYVVSLADPSESVWMAMTNLPDEASAMRVARAVLEARVAACVNRLAPCQSEYWWQGKLEQAQEYPLLIKTTAGQYAVLEAVISAVHPYDVPEVVAWPLAAGLPAYLGWVRSEVTGSVAVPPTN
ncbi:divalent-cation tolerance protein CutA [Cupriavidus sp. 2SB]|uniref:divalent-cation tolerance protein CutA n=1 Tax=Cupriavidus sp. 2SB TaxID=2502199 RepID=UPI0010F5B61E|nr:divalent-cation tolerance protein CutA [Cupriavidus sp. 2SB]